MRIRKRERERDREIERQRWGGFKDQSRFFYNHQKHGRGEACVCMCV